MDRRLFCFGDSFTDFKYLSLIDYTPADPSYDHWSSIVSRSFKARLVNYGQSGGSNMLILRRIIRALPYIKPGDLIITGLSFSQRFELPDINDTTGKNFMSTTGDPQFLHNATEKQKEVVVDFVLNWVHPYEEKWDRYWLNLFESFHIYLKETKDIEYYLWRVKELHGSFQTITEATKGKKEDFHWSEQGNEDFGKFVTEKLNEKFWKSYMQY